MAGETSPGAAAGPYPGHGSIVAPATSASFAAGGGGIVTAQATWNDSEELEMEISCPGGISRVRTGASPESLELDDRHGVGTCTVSLGLSAGATADVSFTLVISPAP